MSRFTQPTRTSRRRPQAEQSRWGRVSGSAPASLPSRISFLVRLRPLAGCYLNTVRRTRYRPRSAIPECAMYIAHRPPSWSRPDRFHERRPGSRRHPRPGERRGVLASLRKFVGRWCLGLDALRQRAQARPTAHHRCMAAGDLQKRRVRRHDDRDAESHGLDGRQAEPLEIRWEHDHRCRGEPAAKLFIRQPRQRRDGPGQPSSRRRCRERLGRPAPSPTISSRGAAS